MSWISVNDGLPEIGERVIVSYLSPVSVAPIQVIADRDSQGWWPTHNLMLSRQYEIVTHWMRYPEPPKGLTLPAPDKGIHPLPENNQAESVTAKPGDTTPAHLRLKPAVGTPFGERSSNANLKTRRSD